MHWYFHKQPDMILSYQLTRKEHSLLSFLIDAAHILVYFCAIFFNTEHIPWRTKMIREKELTNLNP